MSKKILLLLSIAFLNFACKTEKKTDHLLTKTENSIDTTASDMSNNTNTLETEEIVEVTLEDKINDIRTKFKHIENNIASFTKKISNPKETYAVSEIEGYYNDDELVKVVVLEAQGHGSKRISYYFHDDELFFVYKQESGEASLHGPYTDEQTRTYIYDNEVVRVLYKTKTSKTYDVKLMDKVPNKDITATIKDKKTRLTKLITSSKNAIIALENDITKFEEYVWISKDDPNTGIEVRGDQFILFYKSVERTSSDYYNYTTSKENGISYLTLTNNTETLKYAIIIHSSEELDLSYLPRGNILKYRRKK